MEKIHYLEEELKELLKKENSVFDFIQENFLDGIWYWDLEKPENEWMSDKLWQILGFDPEEKEHSPSEWQDLIFEEDLNVALFNLEKHLENPQHRYDQLVRYRHKDGSTVWIQCIGIALRDEDNKPIRMIGAHNNVTEIIKLKEEHKNKESFLDSLISNAPMPIYYKDLEGNFKTVNRAWEEFQGIDKDAILNKNSKDFLSSYHFDTCKKEDEKILKLNSSFVNYETKITNKKTNKVHDVMIYKSAHYDKNNQIAGIIGIILDLTHIKELELNQVKQEEILLAQSKTAAIGEMIGNIAHQWRQPLNLITTRSTGLRFSIEVGHEPNTTSLLETMDNITQQAQYLSKTIDDFRDFFQGDISDISYFNIQDAFEKIYSLTKDSLKNNYINYHCDVFDFKIKGNENLFIQVLINIFNNAKDAMKEDKKDKYLLIKTKVENEFLFIDIKDSGGGINSKILNRIFEPYFTTKGKLLGTGIGLYMSNEIITKQFKGSIQASNSKYDFEDKKLEGALFTIKIPLD